MAGQQMAVQVEMKALMNLITSLDPEVTICIRGRHAIGKSEGTYQAATLLRDDFYKILENQNRYNWKYESGLPVVERRLSQLTEGDLTGMPNLDEERKSTSFKPCDWLIDACNRPVVLFLDERNRALEGVKQAVFQLMDSRAFYGHKLHKGTRVIVAENVGDLYNVQQCDPAEVSRAATVELNPSVDEWLDYARRPGNCHDLTVTFIVQNKEHLEFNPDDQTKTKKVYEPNRKDPDRRSWFKLDQQLQRSGLIDNPENPMFYLMSAAMVGIPAALKFADFAKHYDRQVSLKDILSNWNGAKQRLGIHATSAKYLELSKKLEAHFKTTVLTEHEAFQVGEFMKSAPPEPRMSCWGALQTSIKNLHKVHRFVEDLMVRTATGEDTDEAEIAPVAVPAPTHKGKNSEKK